MDGVLLGLDFNVAEVSNGFHGDFEKGTLHVRGEPLLSIAEGFIMTYFFAPVP
jgi:hypothetical protein